MALKAFIKDLSAVSETEQALYKPVDGGYTVDIEAVDGFGLENVSSLKNALAKMKGDYDQAKNTLKTFGELDPKEVLKKLERYEKLKDLNPEKLKKELALDARADIENEFKGKFDTMSTENDQLKLALKQAARKDVYLEIVKAGGTPEFAKPYIDQFTDVEIEDGKYTLKILGENGKERFDIDNKGNTVPLSAEKLVNELKEHDVYGKMFPSDSKPGRGGGKDYSSTTSEGVKTITNEQFSTGEYNKEVAEGKVRVHG